MTPPERMPERTRARLPLLDLARPEGELLRLIEDLLRRLRALERRG